tara:strand:+ start:10479 stop:10904 length:426 start_codon:yes stop_codon:yes gene_type:complete
MINVFSRDAFIEYIKTKEVESCGEYFISILSTGGPKGVPILKENTSNAISLVFDDVEYDCIKTQYPDGNGLRFAIAMTSTQADKLASFIKQIPTNSIINVHCVHGVSRSAAIGAAIDNKPNPEKGNRHVYKLIKERLHGIS